MKVKALVGAFFSNSGVGRDRGSRAFAVRGASSDLDGSGAPSHPRRHSLVAFCAMEVLALLSALAFLPAVASADGRIGGPNEFPESVLAGGINSPVGVAVSNKEDGDVYITDGSANERVDQFTEAGTFVRAFGWGIVPGAVAGTGDVAAGSTAISNVITTAGTFNAGFFGVGKIITGPGIPAGDEIAGVEPTEIKLLKPAFGSGKGVSLSVAEGPGNVPTNETQELTLHATSGTFTLRFRSPEPAATELTTAAIPYNAPATGSGSVQEALESLSTIGAGNVSVSEGPGDAEGTHPYLITFEGRYADTNVRKLTPNDVSLAGGNPSSTVTVTTPVEGEGVLETCTTVCMEQSSEEFSGQSGNGSGFGAGIGQLINADEIAVDNDESSSSYGDLYVIDQENFRIEKFTSSGQFLLMFGGGVDQGPHHPGNLCSPQYVAEGDDCGAGAPGSGPGFFAEVSGRQRWSEEGSNSIAVGPDGTVYVGDFERIQEFEPDGSYKGELSVPKAQFISSLAVDSAEHVYANSRAINALQFVHKPEHGQAGKGTFTLTFKGQTTVALPSNASAGEIQSALEALSTVGSGNVTVAANQEEEIIFERVNPTAEVEFIGGLARTNVPAMTASNASVEVLVSGADNELVKLGQSGEILQKYDENGHPTHIALDEAGNLYVTEGQGENFQFRTFKPDGTLSAVFNSDQVTAACEFCDGASGIAVGDVAGKLYATARAPEGPHIAVIPLPTLGPPTVAKEEATDVQPTTATLHGIVNPRGFDTEYHFEYVDQASFETQGGFSSPNTHLGPSAALGSINREDLAQEAISGLSTGTRYHYRIVAESHCNEGNPTEICVTNGTDETLETLPPTSIRNFTTQTVGPEVVTIKAELNPNGQSAVYTIRLGESAGNYNLDSSEGTLPLGNEFEAVTATFTGLQPNAEYHYQLIAVSANSEEAESADLTFTTERSSAEEREAENCPNTNLREQNNSVSLPDCRAYERITPTDKRGGEAVPGGFQLSPSGERMSYVSVGAFSGAQANEAFINYVAHRTEGGWISQAVLGRPAPFGTEPVGFGAGFAGEYFSSDLNRWIFTEIPGRNSGEAHGATTGYLSMGFADGSYLLHATPTITLLEGGERPIYAFLEVQGSADDLSRFYIATGSRLLPSPEDPRPDDESGNGQFSRIYEVSGADGPSPSISLVAEVPLGLPSPTGAPSHAQTGCSIDGEGMNPRTTRLTSADGKTLFYTIPIEEAAEAFCGNGTPNPIGLFARIGATAPIQLNAPPPAQCSSPHPCVGGALATPTYYGASPDGSRAWFTTTQPLINSDTDTTKDLYLAKLENGHLSELVQVSAGEATPSHPNPGEGAGVKGVVETSQDASHVAFVATGVLTTGSNSNGDSAEQGAYNLYVSGPQSGEVKFVARICSGAKKSGSLPDLACPADLQNGENGFGEENDNAMWLPGTGPAAAHFTPDGRYLLFTSFGRLASGDTDSVRDAYRYDFQTGQLIRVSVGHNGNDGNGNDDLYPVEIGHHAARGAEPDELAEDGFRSISADGSIVVFSTAAPLVSHDTNAAAQPGCGQHTTGCDVYEWEEQGHGTCTESGGCISLVSDGVNPQGASNPVISPSGLDIIFGTRRGLVAGDTDGIGDAYDARVDGGFPPLPPKQQCGSGESCHPPTHGEGTSPVIGSESIVTSGNQKGSLQCATGRHKERKHGQVRCVPNRRKKHHRKHHNAKHIRRRHVSVGGGK